MSCTLPAKRLYLKGLGKDITTEELAKFLSRYGELCEVKFVHNYAFVEYASETDAQLVYNLYRTEPLMGRRVIIQFARPLRKDIEVARSREQAENRSPLRERNTSRDGLSRHPVVVMGLSPEVRWQELKDFGRSTGCLVAFCDLDRSDPDTGFLEYFTKEDAEFAVQSLDGKYLGGNVVRVMDYRRYSDERKQRRSRARSPCRPINLSNVPTPGPSPTAYSPWAYTGAWGPHSHHEGFHGKQYYPMASYSPTTNVPTYSPRHGSLTVDRYQNTATLGFRGSFDGSCYSAVDEIPDSRYDPKDVPTFQKSGLDPSYQQETRSGACFSDTYLQHQR